MQVPEGSLSFIKWVLKQEPHLPRHGKEHRAKTGGLGSTPTLSVTWGWSLASLCLCFPSVKMQGLGYTGTMGTTRGPLVGGSSNYLLQPLSNTTVLTEQPLGLH